MLYGIFLFIVEHPGRFAYQTRVDYQLPGMDSRGQGARPEMMAMAKSKNNAAYQALFEIEPGEIEINKSVWVTYEIK